MANLQEQIAESVLAGNFYATEKLMNATDFMEFEEAFISASHESESVMFYTFILEMMKKKKRLNYMILHSYYLYIR